jgi:hypothetical protein
LAFLIVCSLFALMAGPARAVDLHFVGTFGDPNPPNFGKDEGLAVDPANDDLLIVDAGGVNEKQLITFSGTWTNNTTSFELENLPPACSEDGTGAITFTGNATRRAAIENAINAKCGVGSVSVTNISGIPNPHTVTFQGPLAGADVPLMFCTPVVGTGSCNVGQPSSSFPDGLGPRLFRFNDKAEPHPFPALGGNVIDGRGFGDETPQEGILGTALAPGEVQVAVAPPGSAGDTSGNIYLTNASNKLVDVFAADGSFIGQLTASGGGPLGKVCGVAVDASGAVYVGDFSGQVHKYVPSANPPVNADNVASFPFVEACSLAAGAGPSAGSVFATHFGGAVAKLDSSTGTEQYVVSSGSNTTVSVDRLTGRVWVASGSEVKGINASGPVEPIPFASGLFPSSVEGVAAHGDDVFIARAATGTIGIHTPVPDIAPDAVTGASGAGADFSLVNLEGEVNPRGFKVDCRFEYDTTEYKSGEAGHGTSVPCDQGSASIGTGTDPVPVTASTEPLEADTTYHYRLVTSNFSQTVAGENETFVSGPAPFDACGNASVRAEQGIAAILLPDCMAFEMVSPPQKGGQSARAPHVSASGDRIKFLSNGGLAGTPGVLGLAGDPYVASREGAKGWTTAPTAPPAPLTKGWRIEKNPSIAASLTPDFSCWFQIVATPQQSQVGRMRAFHGCLGGIFEPLSRLLVPVGGGESEKIVDETRFQAASSDHSHLFFEPGGVELGPKKTSYEPGDPAPSGPGATSNTYIALLGAGGEPSLELLARGRDKDGKVKVFGGNCGSFVGGPDKRNQSAVAADGSRVYLSTRPDQPASGDCSEAVKLRILERLETPQGPLIRELFASPSGVGDDRFQGASVDQSKVYFTTNRQLVGSDLDSGSECNAGIGVSSACDLYLYDRTEPPGERLIQASAGENVAGKHDAGKEAKVLDGTVAISGDGSHVYFAAEGVLSDDESPEGKSAGEYPASTPKLYLYRRDESHPDGDLAFIGPLDLGDRATSDQGNLWGGVGTFANAAYPIPATGKANGVEVGGDGHVLLFISRAALSADDTDGNRSDVYRYDADADELRRLSKARPGGLDGGPFAVEGGSRKVLDPLGTDFAEESRWVSEDGQTVVFDTAEALIRGDRNESFDSYLWRDGRLVRLPGGNPTMSHDGSTVAFTTGAQLLPQDGDGVGDVYVARVGGGSPTPALPLACQPDKAQPGPHCQGDAATPPGAPSSASAGVIGAGNVKPKPRRCREGKRKVLRKGKARCVKRQRGKRNRHARKRNRHANTNRRAGK